MSQQPDSQAQHDDTTYAHVIKYTGLFGGVQGITMLMSIVRTKVAALLLGPAGIAIINLFNNTLKLINQSTNFGVAFSAVREISDCHEQGDAEATARCAASIRTWSVATALLGMLVCLVLSPWLSLWTFDSYGYTWQFVLLAPSLAAMAVTGGEAAILKGMKRLKRVALISVFSAASTLALCLPLYLAFGKRGIAPTLLLCSLAAAAIHLYSSQKVLPWNRRTLSRGALKSGVPIIRLGVAYIIAGVFGQGAEYLIRTSILKDGGLDSVGLYNSGYVMAVSYASLVFIAIEADYFPRLSATWHDARKTDHAVNQQIEVCILLMAPILILFALVMPFVVTLLFSSDFQGAVPMATCATAYMFFKALTLPPAYLPLARGDSRMYMTTELIYDIFIALAIPFAFRLGGLPATGIALSVAGLMDLLLIHTTYRLKYNYRFDFSRAPLYAVQFVLLALTIGVALCAAPLVRWSVGALALALSVTLSLRTLKRETQFVDKLKARLRKKIQRKK